MNNETDIAVLQNDVNALKKDNELLHQELEEIKERERQWMTRGILTLGAAVTGMAGYIWHSVTGSLLR